MMRAPAFALAILVPSIALAEDKPGLEEKTVVSLPYLFGADLAFTSPSTTAGFYWGWRPELVFMWTHARSLGIGIGPYAQLGGSFGTSQIWLGGGGTLVGYFGGFSVALSGGLDVDFLHADPFAAPVVGLFVGYRTPRLDLLNLPFDLPFGARVDVHPAFGTVPTTVILSAQLDLALGAVTAFFDAVSKNIH
jgi:hypothetical protein